MNLKFKAATALILLAVSFSACSTKVTRVEGNEAIDLSGNWNDTDSRLTSEEMIKDMLKQPWLARWQSKKRTPPVLTVGDIRNLSVEHISSQTFVNDIQRVIINSGEAEFVASKMDRAQQRDERAEQDRYASESTRKKERQEIGADYILGGTINTIIDAEGKTAVKYYQIDLTLTEVETQKIAWTGQKKIRKLIENKKIRP
ncbi:MAG: penicillin-binding protein activator LpoB [Helicobacteraceae bacterium]|jgi:uncharacterized protein (TIGR02722 family)|nr:penicillin-binding protein activator LpoB [Helicobacteraceae bacterium]